MDDELGFSPRTASSLILFFLSFAYLSVAASLLPAFLGPSLFDLSLSCEVESEYLLLTLSDRRSHVRRLHWASSFTIRVGHKMVLTHTYQLPWTYSSVTLELLTSYLEPTHQLPWTYSPVTLDLLTSYLRSTPHLSYSDSPVPFDQRTMNLITTQQ